MKTTSLTCLILVSLVTSVFAENAKSIVTKGGASKEVYIQLASNKGISFFEDTRTTKATTMALKDIDSIFFFRPKEFQEGLEFFNEGDFAKAKKSFISCKEKYAKMAPLSENYFSRAYFYEMECARRERKFDEVIKLEKGFRDDVIKNENHLNQIKLYAFWKAYHQKDWKRLVQMERTWDGAKLPGYQKAQIAYCYGVGLEETGDVKGALIQFNSVLALSEFKEMELVLEAGTRIMDIHLADESVEDCLKSQATDDPDRKSKAFATLLEAASIARLWDKSVGVKKLPTKYSKLVSIKPDRPKAEKEEKASKEEKK